MSITIGDTFTEIRVEPYTSKLDLDEVTGSLRPGALANMTKYCSIKWGKHQIQKIEPGVLSHLSGLSLMLDESYKHQIGDALHPHAEPYIHDSNREFVPVGRCFWLWKQEGAFEFSPDERVKWIISPYQTDGQFRFVKAFGSKSVSIIKIGWVSESTPIIEKPIEPASIEKPFYGILTLSSMLDAVIQRLGVIEARLDRVEGNQKSSALPMPRFFLELKESDMVHKGFIPSNVTHLDCDNIMYDRLEPGVIPDSVTHLYVNMLTAKSLIPASVKHLFVFGVRDSLNIPKTVEHVYLHVNCEECAPAHPHYLFYISDVGIPKPYLDRAKYDFGEQTLSSPFDRSLAIVKRTLREQ